MDYINRRAARATMTNRTRVLPATEGQDVGEPLSVTDDVDPYRRSISLQAAARVARLAERQATLATEIESEPIRIDGHLFRRSCKLVLGFAVGTALYAGIMYPFLAMLRSPLPSPDAMAATAPLRR